VECHQKGVVVVYFPSWQHQLELVPTPLQRTKLQVQSQVAHIVPLRIVCLHACFPNTQLYQVYGKVLAMLLSSTWQSRTKIHVGSPVEWRYALQSYGIPTEFIPLTHTGNIKLDKWKQWMKCKTYTEQLDTQERERTHNNNNNTSSSGEATSAASAAAAAVRNQHLQTIVECPGSTDVLFRRGRSVDFHPGNNMFQNLLAAHLTHHAHPSTTPSQQRAIEREVIRQVQQQGQAMGHGGRFLKWELHKGWWSDMSTSSVVNVNVNVHGNNNNNNNNRSQSVDDTDMITTVSSSVESSTNNGGDTTTSSRRSSPMTSVSTTPSKNGTIHTANNNRNNASSRRKEGEWKEQAANPEIQAKVHYAFRDFKIKIKRRAQQQQQKQQEQQQQQQHNNNSSVIEQPVTTHHSCSHLTSAFMNERQDGQQQQKRKRSSSNNNNNNSTHRIDDADDSGSTHSDDRTTSSDRMFCMPFLSDHKNSRNTCGYFPLEEN